MLIVPIFALIFIGGSYFLANRFLPGPLAMKAVPWMAGAAFLGYLLLPFVLGTVLTLLKMPVRTVPIPVVIAIEVFGALGGASLVLQGYVRRHRRRKAEREAQSTAF
jgi:hypothetical protein